jgi:hypothetical protein
MDRKVRWPALWVALVFLLGISTNDGPGEETEPLPLTSDHSEVPFHSHGHEEDHSHDHSDHPHDHGSQIPCQDPNSHNHHNSHCCYTLQGGLPMLVPWGETAVENCLIERIRFDIFFFESLPSESQVFHPPTS